MSHCICVFSNDAFIEGARGFGLHHHKPEVVLLVNWHLRSLGCHVCSFLDKENTFKYFTNTRLYLILLGEDIPGINLNPFSLSDTQTETACTHNGHVSISCIKSRNWRISLLLCITSFLWGICSVSLCFIILVRFVIANKCSHWPFLRSGLVYCHFSFTTSNASIVKICTGTKPQRWW